jgi:8-oxo-dGTP pyrophosphatase MutT (NUDIX family)
MQWKPNVTVAAIVERGGQFLMVDEQADNRQVYNQPAGHLEEGEDLLAAVVRETLEETGRRFTPDAVVGVYLWRNPENSVTFLRVCFCGTVGEQDPQRPLDTGIRSAVWLSREQLAATPHRLRSPLVLQNIDDYLAGSRYPLSLLTALQSA